MALSAPILLTRQHDVTGFHSGEQSLDEWLMRRARGNQDSGATRTYVACNDARIVGYYALASGVVASREATGRFRRNMPDPIPVVLLARLAVDLSVQGHGIGRALVRDASLRVLQAADLIGVRGLLVQAISGDAKAFYERAGFIPSPLDPMLLMVSMADLNQAVHG